MQEGLKVLFSFQSNINFASSLFHCCILNIRQRNSDEAKLINFEFEHLYITDLCYQKVEIMF